MDSQLDFDLDRYLRNSRKVDLADLDWDAIPDHPLSDGDVMSMHYMRDIETHTVIYLRDLLATPAADDPQVTAFLSCWVYEELWHGEAFSDFLRSYGIEVPAEPRLPDGSVPLPSRPTRTARLREQLGIGHRLALLPSAVGSAAFRDFIALHMTWGAINELSTLNGYYMLIRRSSHPVLHEMRRRIIRDERRHFAFYRAQARARLADRQRAQRVVRWILERFWTPVGAGVKSGEEVDALALYLFGDAPEGRDAVRNMDHTIAEIAPAFAGMRLLEDVLDTALERARSRPGYAGTGPAIPRGTPRPGTAAWAPALAYAPREPYAPAD
jgi:hypothetical protein